MAKRLPKISGWGMYPVQRGEISAPRSADGVRELLDKQTDVIARGNGRSYGDSSFNKSGAVSALKLNKFISFDDEQGILVCESGVLLSDVIQALLPLGWFPPVTPGTKFVSIGGMIASNVHGKNCVKDGAFGDHVVWIEIMTANGDTVRCSPTENAALFGNTIGGMGLTGIILRAAFRLRPVETGWIKQSRIVCENLTALFDAFEETENSTYRVAWIDVLAKGEQLGRSLLDIGEHAELNQLDAKQAKNRLGFKKNRTLAVPFAPPISPLNGLTVKAFNAQHYWRGKRAVGDTVVPWGSYFYPLDGLLNWNRIYGRKGFAQYQCVLPLETSKLGMEELLTAISSAGRGSFLAVLKRLSNTIGSLSFPMDGYTLALDFRIYLTKDSRLRQATFDAMQDQSDNFRTMRQTTGASNTFNSLQSERLGL